jgi:hypothetical protein
LWGFLMMACFTLVFVVEFVLRSLWLRDRETAISGGAGVELWPRMLATTSFWFKDMKYSNSLFEVDRKCITWFVERNGTYIGYTFCMGLVFYMCTRSF